MARTMEVGRRCVNTPTRGPSLMRGTDMVERTAPICPDALTLAVAFAYHYGMPRMWREGTTSRAFAKSMAAGDITELDLSWNYEGGDCIVISDYGHRAYAPRLIDGSGGG